MGQELIEEEFSAVTGSGYAVGKDSAGVPGVVLEAKLRALAAVDAQRTVTTQAMVALKAAGLSVRDIARQLEVSKSKVSRELRRTPFRFMPQPEIDAAVEAVWESGLQRERTRLVPREGDLARELTMMLNILNSHRGTDE
ncbi:helix-turn-helix domain-containing protein [Pseudarthrobacter sp. AB1]|uniref:helix-turn-helix domain-containing protein n=1 Tax=Pseudarthrobacter sp. AB1 TaxID=2138309 RepID=UPI00186B9838|nr:helix-turn-helix domain-containing protein [Pseudarthrobacter sp. AB1]MBE4720549.1 hypothetical protein [Pseudarthrobacter sp. AB1]